MLLLQLITAVDEHNLELVQKQKSMDLSANLGSEIATRLCKSAG